MSQDLAKEAAQAREELQLVLASIAAALRGMSEVFAQSSVALDVTIKREQAAMSSYVAHLERELARHTGQKELS